MQVNCVANLLFVMVLAGRAPARTVETEPVDRLTARALRRLTTLSFTLVWCPAPVRSRGTLLAGAGSPSFTGG